MHIRCWFKILGKQTASSLTMVLEPSILDCEVGICHQCEGGELAMMTSISTTNHHSILHWKYALSAHKHFMKKLLLDMFGSADVDMWYVSTISRYLPHVSRLCVFSASDMVNTFLSFDPSYRHLDTALMYSGGKSEQIIGEMKNWRECGGLGNILVSDWSDRLKKLTLLSDWL